MGATPNHPNLQYSGIEIETHDFGVLYHLDTL